MKREQYYKNKRTGETTESHRQAMAFLVFHHIGIEACRRLGGLYEVHSHHLVRLVTYVLTLVYRGAGILIERHDATVAGETLV